MYTIAEKHFIKLDLADEEMTKIRIPLAARRLQVELHEAPHCRDAHVDITAVVAVPSKSCYKIYSEDIGRNVTFLGSEYGCVAVGRMDQGDGTRFVLSNALVNKGVQCKDRDEDVVIHSMRNDVYIRGEEPHELVSNCNRKFREMEKANVTSVPAATYSGRISFFRRGGKVSWQEVQTRVIAGTAGVTARYSGLEFGLEWFHSELKEVLDKEEKGEKISFDEDYDDYDESDLLGWAPAIGGGTGGLILIAVAAVTSFRIWNQVWKSSESVDEGGYHHDGEEVLDELDNGTHRPSAEFRRIDRNLKCLNQIRLNLEKLTDPVKQEEEDTDDDDQEDNEEEEDSDGE